MPPRSEIAEIVQECIPGVLAVAATAIAIAALLSDGSDSVKIAFAGAASTGLGAAAGLAQSSGKKTGTQEIAKAENVGLTIESQK